MSIENFMDELSATACSFDDDYIEIEKQYKTLFGHIVPREMLPPNLSSDDIKKAMKRSIEEGKDIVFDVLKVDINTDYVY